MGIQVKNIFYTYQKKATNATQALADVSLEINDNDFLAIVGETGSGKSTVCEYGVHGVQYAERSMRHP